MRDHDKDFERIDRRNAEVDAMMPTEKGSLSEAVAGRWPGKGYESMRNEIMAVVAPICAAERALAAAEMRERDEDSLRGIVEFARDTGFSDGVSGYPASVIRHSVDDILREYIERSRAK